MVLLPELLYRHAFGRSLLTPHSEWTAAPDGLPVLEGGDSWAVASQQWVPRIALPKAPRRLLPDALPALARRLPRPVKAVLKAARAAATEWGSAGGPDVRLDLSWQPAERYRSHWPRMPAFALPSFYDGRIRINLRGRERDGSIEISRYEETCRGLERMLRECRNPRTGEPMVAFVERAWTRNPLELTGSEADLVVVWRDVAAGLEHPRLGLVGPVPLLRTGGHTGRHGFAYIVAPGLGPGDQGVRSAFDVMPTMARLLGHQPPSQMSGKSLL
jgi:hypothetical protein